ncbi:MAG TPA: YciI family protein [Candidatus Binataceae bacterium]|nr:YciI family protein [Candidatus Binataceae bacterium]
MKFMLLIMNDPKIPLVSEAEMPALLAQFQKVGADLEAARKLVHSSRLRPPQEAKTVRNPRGAKPVVVDGPFSEAKETVGGYFVLECASEAEAVEWAQKFPPGTVVEVRAFWQM